MDNLLEGPGTKIHSSSSFDSASLSFKLSVISLRFCHIRFCFNKSKHSERVMSLRCDNTRSARKTSLDASCFLFFFFLDLVARSCVLVVGVVAVLPFLLPVAVDVE